MTAAAPPVDAAAHCAEAVRTQNFPAYAATLFADPETRRALLALYAFAGEVAGVRDHVSQPLPGEIRLQWWSDALSGADHGGVEGHPVAAELRHAIAAFDLPIPQLSQLIEAWRGDLYGDAIPDLAALEAFVGDTSAVLVALAARICQPQGEVPADLVHHAALAQGLTQLVSLVPYHAARGRLYLPRDLLALNGVTPEEVLAGAATRGLRAVLAYLASEAERHLAAVPAPSRPLRTALLPLALTRKTLGRLRRVEFDPYRLEPVSHLGVLWTYWCAARLGRGL
ncbi:MAG: phytoene/squalene synthase family protein [Xanthobacteraceae bacterium]|nr:phytoene/squalene synthase family protein [Xanthobacteraceae bacterium]